jgi:N-carbamoylputrescine amidase
MVKPLRIAFVEWPEAFSTDHPRWCELKNSIVALHPDILITNELPFGPWIAESAVYSEDQARLSICAHEEGLKGLP